MIRFFALLLLIIAIFTLPFFASIIMASVYAVFWFAPELIFLALLVDIYYGTESLPLYFITCSIALFLAEFVRSGFSFYTK